MRKPHHYGQSFGKGAATGEPLGPNATCRLVTNDSMYDGGDEYTTFYSDVLFSNAMVEPPAPE